MEEQREEIRTRKAVTTKYVFSGQTMILPRILIFYFPDHNLRAFQVLADYLLVLLDNNFITLNTLNEHLLALLRCEEWSPEKYKQLSHLMRIIGERRGDQMSSKDGVLLDVLSELTANIDDFPEEF